MADKKIADLADGLDLGKVVDLIRIAETAERYEDMCVFVKKMVNLKHDKEEDLDVDERNLLSVAYKVSYPLFFILYPCTHSVKHCRMW